MSSKKRPPLAVWAASSQLEELQDFLNVARERLCSPRGDERVKAARRLVDVVLAARGAKVAFDLQVTMWRASHVVEQYRRAVADGDPSADRVLDAALRWEFEEARKTSRKRAREVAIDQLMHDVRRSLGEHGRSYLREHEPARGAAYLLLRAGVVGQRDRPLTHAEAENSSELKDRARDIRRARKLLDERR